nr:MAG TPA: hypothetical protein [Caudoviricetes sp.]
MLNMRIILSNFGYSFKTPRKMVKIRWTVHRTLRWTVRL